MARFQVLQDAFLENRELSVYAAVKTVLSNRVLCHMMDILIDSNCENVLELTQEFVEQEL